MHNGFVYSFLCDLNTHTKSSRSKSLEVSNDGPYLHTNTSSSRLRVADILFHVIMKYFECCQDYSTFHFLNRCFLDLSVNSYNPTLQLCHRIYLWQSSPSDCPAVWIQYNLSQWCDLWCNIKPICSMDQNWKGYKLKWKRCMQNNHSITLGKVKHVLNITQRSTCVYIGKNVWCSYKGSKIHVCKLFTKIGKYRNLFDMAAAMQVIGSFATLWTIVATILHSK